MQIAPAACFKRKCRHYRDYGIVDGQVKNICTAFPDGIPNDIAYEGNRHLEPVAGDHGIQFEKQKPIVAIKKL